jgi:hypothetical protein
MTDPVVRSPGLSTNASSIYKIALKSSYVGSKLGDLRFCHLNPGSLVKNIDEFKLFFENLDMDVVCISESWLKKHHSDRAYGINGFNLFRADRRGNRRSGGCAIYVNSKYKCKVLNQSTFTAPVNYLFLEMNFHGQKVLIGCFYDPPTISGYSLYGQHLENLIPQYEHNLFLGDFNVNLSQ